MHQYYERTVPLLLGHRTWFRSSWYERVIRVFSSLTFQIERPDLAVRPTLSILRRELLKTRDLIVRRGDVNRQQEPELIYVITNSLKPEEVSLSLKNTKIL